MEKAKKYIDEDVLRVYMKTFLTGNDLYNQNGIERFVESLPAADVQEVTHGLWEQDRQDKWRCSVCKAGNNYAYSWDTDTKEYTKLQDKYCPNCGAKMDEE